MDTRKMMAESKFYESYSRFINETGKYETWDESVERVMNMHKTYYKDKLTPELIGLLDEVEDAYKDKIFLGSQRALQFGGEQLLRNHNKLFNCTSTYCDRPKVFSEIMYMMLCGCGVGFSVQQKHIKSLPDITTRGNEVISYIIEDSIEGWADATDVMINSFFADGNIYSGKMIKFDYSLIRSKGSLISGGFKAPGHEPLKVALEKIEVLLMQEAKKSKRMRSIVVYDVNMYIADAVIAGGVRRAATICLFNKDDTEMMTAKTGDWWTKHPERARSNNSCLLLRNETSKEEFNEIIKSVKDYGEPGFIWVDDLDVLFNPCQPDFATVLTPDGIRTFKDIDVGSTIWSKDGWTKVIKKWKTGRKQVNEYKTTNGSFIGTENHRVIENGKKVEVKDAKSVDTLVGPFEHTEHIANFVKDGLLIGNGKVINGSIQFNVSDIDTMLTDFLEIGIDTSSSIRVFDDLTTRGLLSPHKQTIPGRYVTGTNNEVRSFLRGLYSVNGSVENNVVVLTHRSIDLITQVQLMLNSLSIVSSIISDVTKEDHTLNITTDKEKFSLIVGFIQEYKTNKLNDGCDCSKHMRECDLTCGIDNVVNLGMHDVYDITVDNDSHTYWTGGVNVSNCVEIGLYGYSPKGESGFSVCNLVEINGGKSTSKEIFLLQCKVATIMGTLQAGYTNFNYLSKATKDLVEAEHLLGVSITGWMNNPDVLFDKDILAEGVAVCEKWNKITANIIDIDVAARVTCVKPAGNTSVLLGTSSGIHGEHSKLYLRHVQFNKETEMAQLYKKHNPEMVEESVYSENDIVVAFPITTPDGSVFKNDLLGVKQLEKVVEAQKHWVEPGTNHDRCLKPFLRHNVSNTITVDDWDAVSEFIYENRYDLGGISLLAAVGDKAYTQAPFTEVLTAEEIFNKYGTESMFTSALIEAGLNAFDMDLWNASNTAQGFGEILTDSSRDLLKRDFVRRFNKFSTKFKDVQECSNCIKDIYNLHKWWKISKNIKELDWDKYLTTEVITDIGENVGTACGGGACEI